MEDLLSLIIVVLRACARTHRNKTLKNIFLHYSAIGKLFKNVDDFFCVGSL